MANCKHKWIDVGDGSRDKLCVRCGKRAAQAVALLPWQDIRANIKLNMPNPDPLRELERETMRINNQVSPLLRKKGFNV